MQYSDRSLTCADAAPLLPALGDLPEARRREVVLHLESCVSCAAEARAYRAVDALVRDDPFPGVPLPSGRSVVTGILEQEAARARPSWSRWAWAPAAAVAASLIFVAARPEPAPTPVPAPAVEVEPLPVLRIVDDEQGRSVWLSSPTAADAGDRERADRKL
ncbi:MAG: anti-sigma factor family protein [Armatimonadota bacterium]